MLIDRSAAVGKMNHGHVVTGAGALPFPAGLVPISRQRTRFAALAGRTEPAQRATSCSPWRQPWAGKAALLMASPSRGDIRPALKEPFDGGHQHPGRMPPLRGCTVRLSSSSSHGCRHGLHDVARCAG
jgi:hypothetical protein